MAAVNAQTARRIIDVAGGLRQAATIKKVMWRATLIGVGVGFITGALVTGGVTIAIALLVR